MSELKGQLLGLIIVLVLFGTVSLAATGVFDRLVGKINEQTTEVVGE